jgi:very-short-patch-repair endonuclease
LHSVGVNPIATARQLRRDQTDAERDLWRALRGRRFAGFKFRRQYVVAPSSQPSPPLGEKVSEGRMRGTYILDFYCAAARLAVELDGFQHGLPEGLQRDAVREKFLAEQDIETLRFWNRQWRENREGCLLAIWDALQRRTGCVRVMKNVAGQRFVPPEEKSIKRVIK